jgi:hypothetical protein
MAQDVAGVIINPLSGGDNRRGRELARMLREHGAERRGVRILMLEDFGRLEEMLRDLAASSMRALFISSGDGTIQAIQTWLAENLPGERLPRLGLLPHGTTNMTAADIGFRDKSLRAQRDYILAGRWSHSPDIVTRPSLRLANPGNGGPQHGMFLGAGAIARGTLFCQQHFNRRGVRGNWLAPALTLAMTAGRALLGGPAGPEDEDRLDRPVEMTVTADGRAVGRGLHVAALVTTLEKLVFAARPFPPGKPESLKAAVFLHPPPGLLRWLPVILWGRKDGRRLPESVRLFHAETLEIDTDDPLVLDGERIMPPSREPLRVETGPVFQFLRG